MSAVCFQVPKNKIPQKQILKFYIKCFYFSFLLFLSFFFWFSLFLFSASFPKSIRTTLSASCSNSYGETWNSSQGNLKSFLSLNGQFSCPDLNWHEQMSALFPFQPSQTFLKGRVLLGVCASTLLGFIDNYWKLANSLSITWSFKWINLKINWI